MAASSWRISVSALRPARSTSLSAPLVVLEHGGQLVPDRADLEHHHADRVGDDVVQLACDPRALLGDRDACGRLALPFGLGRADLGRLGLLGALAQGKACGPAMREVDRDQDELGGDVAGDVVDDRDDASEDDREPGPRLPASRWFPSRKAATSPTGKRLTMNGMSCPSTNEMAVGDQPVGRGRREGKPPAGEERSHQQGHRRDGEAERHGRRVPARGPVRCMAATRSAPISSSNQYSRAKDSTRLMR